MTATRSHRTPLQCGSTASQFNPGFWRRHVSRRAVGAAADGWEALSRDLIERFIDVTCFERGLSRSARRGYRADLIALDRWLGAQVPPRSLVGARGADLRAFFRQRVSERWEPRLLDRLLASMHAFYRYASESGCREDNPAKRLPLTFAQSVESSRPPLEQLFIRARR